jgi:hypothetical protein
MAVEKASFTVAGLRFHHTSVENLSIRGIKKEFDLHLLQTSDKRDPSRRSMSSWIS